MRVYYCGCCETAKKSRETEGYEFICVGDKEVSKRTEGKGDVIKFVHSRNLFDVMDEEKGLRMKHIFLGIEVVIGTIL